MESQTQFNAKIRVELIVGKLKKKKKKNLQMLGFLAN
jgi:hypothetical protein